jgi:hypothetical protein
MRRHPADHNGYHDHTRSILKLAAEFQCLLLGVKRTFRGRTLMSAFDPKRTSARSRPTLFQQASLRLRCPV